MCTYADSCASPTTLQPVAASIPEVNTSRIALYIDKYTCLPILAISPSHTRPPRTDRHLPSTTLIVAQKLNLLSEAECEPSKSSCLNHPQTENRSSLPLKTLAKQLQLCSSG